jgi:hypothetical protein
MHPNSRLNVLESKPSIRFRVLSGLAMVALAFVPAGCEEEPRQAGRSLEGSSGSEHRRSSRQRPSSSRERPRSRLPRSRSRTQSRWLEMPTLRSLADRQCSRSNRPSTFFTPTMIATPRTSPSSWLRSSRQTTSPYLCFLLTRSMPMTRRSTSWSFSNIRTGSSVAGASIDEGPGSALAGTQMIVRSRLFCIARL